MTDDELKAIAERVGAASPGPWEFERHVDDETGEWRHACSVNGPRIHERGIDWIWFSEWFEFKFEGGPRLETDDVVVQRMNDMRFAAHARQDIPALLAEVRRLRAELAALRPLAEAAMQYGTVTTKDEFDAAIGTLINTATAFVRARAQAAADAQISL